MTSVQPAREALGQRLRDLRLDAGLTGKELADRARWHPAKVTKIEYGRQTPSENDLNVWCATVGAPDQLPDLVAALRNIKAAWMEWRRSLGTGTRRRQRASIALEAQTQRFRWYEPGIVPGLLQTPSTPPRS